LPAEWNFLVGHDQKMNPNKLLAEEAKILHFTNGLPDVHPTDGEADNLWRQERARMNHVTPA